MAQNNQLIKGAADVYGSQAGGLMDQVAIQQGAQQGMGLASKILLKQQNKRAAANQHYQQQVNSYMGNLKTDIDFTGFSASETATMRNFLMTERTKYTEAAKMAGKYSDTTDPNYLMYVDQMQNVNNSFTNLAKQLESYKTGKAEYAKNQMNNEVSLGTDPSVTRENNTIYGFIDNDGDGENDNSPDDYIQSFYIGQGGNLKFSTENGEVAYNNVKSVDFKDYTLANEILTNNESVYKSGQKMNQIEEDQYVLSLQQKLQNPKALKSLVFDFGASGIRLEGIADQWSNDAESGPVDLDMYRNMVIEQLVTARKEVALKGYTEKQRKSNSSGSAAPKAIQTFNEDFASLEDTAWASNPNGYAVRTAGGGKIVFNRRQGTGPDANKRYLTIKRGDAQEVIIYPDQAKEEFGIIYEPVDFVDVDEFSSED